MMIEPPRDDSGRDGDLLGGDPPAHGNSLDGKALACAVVRLDKHPDCEAAVGGRKDPRSSADTALEAVADHACAAADVPLGNGARYCGIDGGDNVLRPDVLTVYVVQPPVPGLADDRQAP